MTEQSPFSHGPERESFFAEMSARRIFNLVKTPITLLVLLTFVVFGGWWGLHALTSKPAPPKPVPCQMRDVGGSLKTSQVTVRVSNGGSKRGLAKSVGNSLKSVQFNVEEPSNADQRIMQTIIKGNDPKSPEVLLVAAFFPNAKIVGDGRVDHVVDIYVGNKYEGLKLDAPKELAVPGQVCLPAVQSPTPSTPPK